MELNRMQNKDYKTRGHAGSKEHFRGTNAHDLTRKRGRRWALAIAAMVLVLAGRGAMVIAANPRGAANEILHVQLYSSILNAPFPLMTRARELLRELAE